MQKFNAKKIRFLRRSYQLYIYSTVYTDSFETYDWSREGETGNWGPELQRRAEDFSGRDWMDIDDIKIPERLRQNVIAFYTAKYTVPLAHERYDQYRIVRCIKADGVEVSIRNIGGDPAGMTLSQIAQLPVVFATGVTREDLEEEISLMRRALVQPVIEINLTQPEIRA